jgi:hypothetical protein
VDAGDEAEEADAVRGLSAREDGLELVLDRRRFEPAQPGELSFRITEGKGTLTRFEREHQRELHLIVVRDDLTGFQHLHPRMAANGTWSTPLTLPEAGTYRVFADFNSDGASYTLARDLTVAGQAERVELPLQHTETTTDTGYEVGVEGELAGAGEEAMLSFNVLRDGEPVAVEPYLGADGHLVALREGDLAYLHVHPLTGGEGDEHGAEEEGGHGEGTEPAGDAISFMTEFPTEGSYRLFLQFKHAGEVHTAAFTREIAD